MEFRRLYPVIQPELWRYNLHLGAFAVKGGDYIAVKAAGLPNITGSIIAPDDNIGYQFLGDNSSSLQLEGAFSITTRTAQTIEEHQTTTTAPASINFNASLSNAIYGNSDTVSPATLTMIMQYKF